MLKSKALQIKISLADVDKARTFYSKKETSTNMSSPVEKEEATATATTLGSLSAIPHEIVRIVFLFFDRHQDLEHLRLTCATLKMMVDESTVWRHLIARKVAFPTSNLGKYMSSLPAEDDLETLGFSSWRMMYRKHLKYLYDEKQRLLKEREKFKAKREFTRTMAKGLGPPNFSTSKTATMWSKLKQRVGLLKIGDAKHRFIFCGLDAAGKTTTLYKLGLGDVVAAIPTIGFCVETVEVNNVELTVWDVGGPDKIRPLWRHYYQSTTALIWMVDSNDRERIEESRRELDKILKEDDAFPAGVVLVFANKQDLPNAMSIVEVTDKLGLGLYPPEIDWYIQPCCATTGDGLYEGLSWLSKTVMK